MQGGHGDQNSKKQLTNISGCKTKKIPSENIKISKFRVILACDRRYDTFDMKKENILFKSLFLKTSQPKKNLYKYQKLLTFSIKNPKKTCCSWCFCLISPFNLICRHTGFAGDCSTQNLVIKYLLSK